ncbi:N-acetylmuramoyl-L-alanine amidase [Paracoccus caeni]|uniref:N-acetylmuramoyl-L-alanine amidase n=1 Tax=Paracoccus caeni TaxID=657651 RepID=A0A934SFP6_9RHOB|nr:N-acetylmuramoyl-L-alanine amidase [Paracoccus caeni]MBK4217032.1 N-acetylmuramoyl-L-alanine amidase [Paracoccus caeni]
MTAVMNAVRAQQARCAALGFWPGPIDGIDGPRTRAAYAAAVASQKAKGLPFRHPTGITRIHWHWTGGGHEPNATDLKAYHALIDGAGKVRWPVDPTTPRSHTLNASSGAIGLSLCAMLGAKERPFDWGKAPITAQQVSTLVRETARLCRVYDIPLSHWSVLSHAEIQPSLGVIQKNKWDIAVLPDIPGPADPITVGDHLREMVRCELFALS